MAYDFQRLQVLIVDDNRFMGDLLRMVLRSFGLDRVSVSECPLEGLSYLESHAFDLAFFDYEMPAMSGLDLISRVRGHHNDLVRFLPVVMCSAHVEEERVLRARDVGATEFLVKPFTTQAIYERLASLIERPRPFVREACYFGPDRRRKLADVASADRRVRSARGIDGPQMRRAALRDAAGGPDALANGW
ncbi:MAG: response regulator [Marivibrio sp.]|uniref:response regulator n=1 Tax=Marivibrio sp. TaxID=2039719 RepID=UPI0032EFC38E